MSMQLPVKRDVHVKDYLDVLTTHRWLILAILMIVAGAGTAWTLSQPRVFLATATILIDPEPPKVLNIQEVSPMGATGGDYYSTQYEIIRSRAVVDRVIQNL